MTADDPDNATTGEPAGNRDPAASGGRDEVMRRVREAVRDCADRTPLPDWDPGLVVARNLLGAGSLWEDFARNLAAVNGRPMTSVGELAAFLLAGGHRSGFCDPALRDPVGAALEDAGVGVSYAFDRARIDDHAFGITRASGAIAETGSIILDDHLTVDRLAALAPWVHVAVVERSRIVGTIPEALEQLGAAPNIVWVTGPSKTADIEGILIEGVHGPGEQVCLVID